MNSGFSGSKLDWITLRENLTKPYFIGKIFSQGIKSAIFLVESSRNLTFQKYTHFFFCDAEKLGKFSVNDQLILFSTIQLGQFPNRAGPEPNTMQRQLFNTNGAWDPAGFSSQINQLL